jgi:PAS domain S-box-containing protein
MPFETERLFGYSRGELSGQAVEILIPERFRVGHRELRDSCFASASTRRTGKTCKILGKRKDGTELPIELGFNPLDSGDGVFLISEILDLTTGDQASKPPDA